MSRDTPNQHPRSHLFTMRVWQEEVGHDRTEWRGKVHLITTGNMCYFRGWEGLVPPPAHHALRVGDANFTEHLTTLVTLL